MQVKYLVHLVTIPQSFEIFIIWGHIQVMTDLNVMINTKVLLDVYKYQFFCCNLFCRKEHRKCLTNLVNDVDKENWSTPIDVQNKISDG